MLCAYSTNVPAGFTGGFGEPNCTQCHTGTLNPAGGSVSIGRPGFYPAGGTALITVTIQDSSEDRKGWGFQLSARFPSGKQAGSFAAGTNVRVQTSPSGVQYAAHQPSASQAGVHTYTFSVSWTAPPDASGGDVIFHAAGMASDGSGSGGDHVFFVQTVSLAPLPPRISAGGIVDAASFTPAPDNFAAPGSLISIFGENLASTSVVSLATPLPTELDGTGVLINGVPAPLVYVSRMQINAQVPAGLVGAFDVLVVAPPRRPSEPELLRVERTAPALFTFTGKGTGAAAILHFDSKTPVSEALPARTGEIVVMFCTGLGATSPSLATGQAAPVGEQAPLYFTAETPVVTIGGMNAEVKFSGAAPGLVGVYQINTVVPNVDPGVREVIVRIGGRQSAAAVTVLVQR